MSLTPWLIGFKGVLKVNDEIYRARASTREGLKRKLLKKAFGNV